MPRTRNGHQTQLFEKYKRRRGELDKAISEMFIGGVSTLSGGERSRLQLAKLMLSGVNFLLFDEPTNNLDLPSCEVLEKVLAEFEGTVLVVSHDRYFLDRVVDRIVELDEGTLTEYPGDYGYYREEKARRTNQAASMVKTRG